MRILLLYPPQPKIKGGICPSYLQQRYSFLYPPLGLLYLASNLDRNKHQVKIIDSNALKLSLDGCIDYIKEFKPDILGITVLTDLVYFTKTIAEGAKALFPNIRTVLGGPHINIYPYETMAFRAVDFCLQHFAETSFGMLLRAVEDNSGYNNVPGLFYKHKQEIYKSAVSMDSNTDLDSLKPPDRRLLDNSKYFTVVDNKIITTAITSRGCPFQCTFCDVFQKKYLYRSPEDVIEEVKGIVNLGIRSIHFFDDNFNLVKDRVIKFCELLLRENIRIEWSFRGRAILINDKIAKLLYDSGCRRVQLGIESADEKTLKIIKKQIDLESVKEAVDIYKRNKILTLGYFIMGFPHESYEDCFKSARNAMRLGFDYIQFSILTPYPNTEIYCQLLKDGVSDHWLEFARNPQDNYLIPHLHPTMPRSELERLVNYGYKRFYFSPYFILKELSRMRGIRALVLKIKAALKVFLTRDY